MYTHTHTHTHMYVNTHVQCKYKQAVRPIVWSPQYAPAPATGDLNSHPERHHDLWPLWNVSYDRHSAQVPRTNNLLANFGLSATSHCQVTGNHASDWRYDLITLTCDVTGLVSDVDHRTPSVYQVWSLQAFPFWRYGWFSVMVLSGLVTVTFWPLNGVKGHPCHGLPSCQFSASYALPFST